MRQTTLLERFTRVVAVLVAISATMFAAWTTYYGQRSKEAELELREREIELLKQQTVLAFESKDIKFLIESRVKAAVESQVTETVPSESSNLLLRVAELGEIVAEVKNQTSGLRQAINPKNPEEILTIARISDRLEAISKDMTKFEERMENQQSRFRESLQREVQSSNNATNLIIVALIPLILNLVYSIWKDTRTVREENGE